MIEIPPELRCLFSATVESRDGSYVIELPREQVEHSDISPETIYRIAILPQVQETGAEASDDGDDLPEPPVDQGEVRTVEIETTGEQGDGIAKVERGYVLIVPGAEPGEEVSVEIEQVKQTFAIAQVIEEGGVGI
jgi:predicted RNA-binding protein with TRAM domain